MLALIDVRSIKAPMPRVGPLPVLGLPSVPASHRYLASLRLADSLKVLDSEMPPYTAPLLVILALITVPLFPIDLALKNITTRARRKTLGQVGLLLRRLRLRIVLVDPPLQES